MAYAKRKYHSGLIWVGVTIGLHITQLSASIYKRGEDKVNIIKKSNYYNKRDGIFNKVIRVKI